MKYEMEDMDALYDSESVDDAIRCLETASRDVTKLAVRTKIFSSLQEQRFAKAFEGAGHIRKLLIENCTFNDLIQPLSAALESNTSLKTLSLQGNSITHDVDAIARMLAKNRDLTSLNLSQNRVTIS